VQMKLYNLVFTIDCVFQLVSTSGPSHAPVFVVKASLNEMSFEGSGKSKKDAKLNASKALLVHLHKVRCEMNKSLMFYLPSFDDTFGT